jgi:hypothetical protein
MNTDCPPEAIDELVQSTEDLVDVALTSSKCRFINENNSNLLLFLGDMNRRHMEYLPYPDWNLSGKSEDHSQEVSIDENSLIFRL